MQLQTFSDQVYCREPVVARFLCSDLMERACSYQSPLFRFKMPKLPNSFVHCKCEEPAVAR